MQNNLKVGGVVVKVGHCGQQVVLENSTDKPVHILAGNAQEKVPSHSLTILPGGDIKIPVGGMNEMKVQVVKLVPVTTLDIIDIPELGLMAGLLGVGMMDKLVDEGTLKIS